MQKPRVKTKVQSLSFSERSGLEAIILAGGLGTRLQSVVTGIPKCLAPVNGMAFLSFVIAHLQRNGIEHYIFSLGYKSELIIDFLEREYQHISKRYVVEKAQLGTGGAIKEACKYVKGKNVIVVNGDTLFNIDINRLISVHNKNMADCTIALKFLRNFNRYGAVMVNGKYQVKTFTEKKQQEQGYINGGIYILNLTGFLNEPLPGKFSFEKEWLEKNIGIKRICGVKNDKYFLDIGIPEDYEKAKTQLANMKI